MIYLIGKPVAGILEDSPTVVCKPWEDGKRGAAGRDCSAETVWPTWATGELLTYTFG